MDTSSAESPESLVIAMDNLRPLNTNSSQASTSQYSPQPADLERLESSSIFRQIAKARAAAGYDHSPFYFDADVINSTPNGLPSLAASQMYYPTELSRRTFRCLTNRALTFDALRLSCIENKLHEFDLEDQEGDEQLNKGLPFDREGFIARCLESPDESTLPRSRPSEGGRAAQKENLMMNARSILKDHFELSHLEYRNRKFAKVSRAAHEAQWRTARDVHDLKYEVYDLMRYADDSVIPDDDLLLQRFEHLIYTKRPWVAKALKFLCGGRELPTDDDGKKRMIFDVWKFQWVSRALIGLLASSLLLVAIGLLYLVPMSKSWAFGVVVIFVNTFNFAFTFLEQKVSTVLVGDVAFGAVLGTFMPGLRA
ncbi:hypothetical protein F4778DRAFT_11286 [Xylariomycetidae sp. FL2044]|nr:hypothetical protein F4778DRAFT_11286 [Xylariomycetidae sp. FL2044]